MRNNDSLDWTNSGAPISQVLNDASSTHHTTEPTSTAHYVSAAPFSGKLIDLLLDTTGDITHERRRIDHQPEDTSRLVSENSVITLPQPAQPPAKTARRPRIPPLLQGLHQPPPLPPAERLFPPITDGVSGFQQEICERIQSGNAVHESRNKKDEGSLTTRTSEPNSPHSARKEPSEMGKDGATLPKVTTDNNKPKKTIDSKSTNASSTVPRQQNRKRKKWSDEETRDLLLGVSRLGIGSWKKILECSDFKFQGRTAVDLKDRFRVCCPGEGLKPRQPKRRKGDKNEQINPPGSTVCSTDSPDETRTGAFSGEPRLGKTLFAEGAGSLCEMDSTELANLGIHAPFAKSTRRPRHAFSATDDENLLKGFEKHGAGWLTIRDDKDLGFETRHPTDLRDRFRIRYPEAYERAGYKLKAKRQSRLRHADLQEEEPIEPEQEVDTNAVSAQNTGTQFTTSDPQDPNRKKPEEHPVSTASRARPLTYPHTSATTDPSPIFPDFPEEDERMSPIILNRNILQWADANTSSMPLISNGVYFGSYTARDTSSHTAISTDGLHINPLATLKLPVLSLSDHTTLPSTQPYTANVASTSGVSSSTADPNILAWPGPGSNFPKSSSSSSHNLLRTPNLPTIVFPHVPAISARTTVHNLPTPADLLSGLDTENGDVVMEHGSGSASGFGMGSGGMTSGDGNLGMGDGR